jgi:hypothetical protein
MRSPRRRQVPAGLTGISSLGELPSGGWNTNREPTRAQDQRSVRHRESYEAHRVGVEHSVVSPTCAFAGSSSTRYSAQDEVRSPVELAERRPVTWLRADCGIDRARRSPERASSSDSFRNHLRSPSRDSTTNIRSTPLIVKGDTQEPPRCSSASSTHTVLKTDASTNQRVGPLGDFGNCPLCRNRARNCWLWHQDVAGA